MIQQSVKLTNHWTQKSTINWVILTILINTYICFYCFIYTFSRFYHFNHFFMYIIFRLFFFAKITISLIIVFCSVFKISFSV